MFSFEDVLDALGVSQQTGLKHASLLRGRGYLVLFGRRGRSRQYRLLSPEQAIFAHLHMKNLAGLRQGRYTHLLVDACSQLHRARKLVLSGLWLFGSVATREARDDSDVDLVVVAKSLTGRRAEMTGTVYASLDIARERQFLYQNGVATDLSIYALKEEELRRFYPLLLDVVEDGIVLYEREGILTRAAGLLRARWSEVGMRREKLSKGWMWTIPSGQEVGKPLEVRETVRGVP